MYCKNYLAFLESTHYLLMAGFATGRIWQQVFGWENSPRQTAVNFPFWDAAMLVDAWVWVFERPVAFPPHSISDAIQPLHIGQGKAKPCALVARLGHNF
jgi:hypothetical protein